MPDLSIIDKRKLELLLGMGGGYILNFSNKTIQEFVLDSVRRDFYDGKYQEEHSGSKANRLRSFWRLENNATVAKLLHDLIALAAETPGYNKDSALLDECRAVAARLKNSGPVVEIEALMDVQNDKEFEVLVEQLRQAIDGDRPEAALDRLHTFAVRFVRNLCDGEGIPTSRDKPLHSLFGEYVRHLRDGNHLHSEMSARILKSSISVLEAFNDVRNNQSLAHDNPVLNYEESLLILNHFSSTVRFLRALDQRLKASRKPKIAPTFDDDEVPF